MKTIIQIIKGVMLWVTLLSISCFLAGGCESLMEQNNWLATGFWLFINIALVYICYYNISYREFWKLSGGQLLTKILEGYE